jgi:hypothetical protein
MEFNDLTDDERTDLQDQIRGLAWAFARRAAGFGGASPYDRALLRLADSQRVAETADLTPGDRRNMYLARLRVLGIMQSELDRAADLEAYCAGAEGANFRELGDAWGISRLWGRLADDPVPDLPSDPYGAVMAWRTWRSYSRLALVGAQQRYDDVIGDFPV